MSWMGELIFYIGSVKELIGHGLHQLQKRLVLVLQHFKIHCVWNTSRKSILYHIVWPLMCQTFVGGKRTFSFYRRVFI